MSAKGKKVVFGALLFLSATIVLTWMNYASRTPVENLSANGYYKALNMKKSESAEELERRKGLVKMQLEIVKSLANEEVKVTSDDASSDYSSDSLMIEKNDDNNNDNDGQQKADPSIDEAEEERRKILQIEDENEENHDIEADDDSSASESGFSETNKWPWLKDQNTAVDDDATEHVAISNNIVRTQALNNEVVRTQALNDENVRTEALNGEVVRTQALNDENVRTQAFNDANVRTNALNDEVVRTQAVSQEIVKTDALSSKEIIRTQGPSDQIERTHTPDAIARTKKTMYSNSTELTVEQKMRQCVNYYKWNDRDPDAYKSLPLRTAGDSPSQPQERVVFNRVGKCGSRSVIVLLRHLAIMNNFYLIGSEVYNTTRIDEVWQERLVHSIDQLQTPFLFQRHLHYVDFTSYGSTPPVYINIVRDPLARLVSQYYFKRFGDGRGKDRYNGPEDERYQTFDECVLNKKPECIGNKAFYITPFFCGQNHDCKKASRWALDQAIRNVEEKYLFVGILEEFEDTLRVLERLLPSMFNHALEYYLHPVGEAVGRNRSSTVTLHKQKPSPEVAEIMKQELDVEYQFYNFIKTKFHKQRDALGMEPYKKPAS